MITRERLEKISSWREKYGDDHNVMLTAAEAEEMARRLLAAEAQEPVGLFAKRNGTWLELCQGDTFEHPEGVLLYSAPQPVAGPVRYMNRYTGACYTLEQQPNSATDTAVYVPLYDVAHPVAVPDEIDVNDPALDTHRKWMAEGWNRCRATMLSAAPVNPEFTTHLVGEVVAWHHPNHERNVDFRWLDFNVEPGTKLYAIKQERG